MKTIKLTLMMALLIAFGSSALADNYRFNRNDGPDIEIWTNKGYDSRYYYGEDVAVFFRAEQDCYVVVYDIDPSGAVTVLYPSNYYNSAYVKGGEVYRIPDYYSDYRLEVSGESGTEHIFAVATYEYLEPPDFVGYLGYDYGQPEYYDDAYFVNYVRGDLDEFVRYLNHRFTSGPYSVAHTRFFVDISYRHHRHYRYWDYDPYYVGSVWVGCNYPGAEIWIDGVYFGIAPLLIPRIWFGYHWVWVYYGGYPCYQRYFHITSYDRYYIDVRIDNSYKDYRYRRRSFDGWRPLEKRYRNEDGFEKRAREARLKKVARKRELPSHVISDFAKRGVIRENSPLAKRVVDDTRAREAARLTQKRQKRSEIDRPAIEKPGRQTSEPSGQKDPDKKKVSGEARPGIRDADRVIVPERNSGRESKERIETKQRENERFKTTPRENNRYRDTGKSADRKETLRKGSQKSKTSTKSSISKKSGSDRQSSSTKKTKKSSGKSSSRREKR
jgi:hypothetical protein